MFTKPLELSGSVWQSLQPGPSPPVPPEAGQEAHFAFRADNFGLPTRRLGEMAQECNSDWNTSTPSNPGAPLQESTPLPALSQVSFSPGLSVPQIQGPVIPAAGLTTSEPIIRMGDLSGSGWQDGPPPTALPHLASSTTPSTRTGNNHPPIGVDQHETPGGRHVDAVNTFVPAPYQGSIMSRGIGGDAASWKNGTPPAVGNMDHVGINIHNRPVMHIGASGNVSMDDHHGPIDDDIDMDYPQRQHLHYSRLDEQIHQGYESGDESNGDSDMDEGISASPQRRPFHTPQMHFNTEPYVPSQENNIARMKLCFTQGADAFNKLIHREIDMRQAMRETARQEDQPTSVDRRRSRIDPRITLKSGQRFGRPKPLDDVLRPSDFVNHRPQERTKLMEVIREALLKLLRLKHAEELSLTPSFEPGAQEPSEDNFKIDWTQDAKSPWNRKAIEVLLGYVRRVYAFQVANTSVKVIHRAIVSHLRYRRLRLEATSTPVKRAKLALKESALTRKEWLLKRRFVVLEQYKHLPGMRDIYELYWDMGVHGVSSDEEDPKLSEANGRPTYVVHPRRDLSPAVTRCSMHLDMLYNRLIKPKYGTGAEVHDRVRSKVPVLSETPHRPLYCLPRNAYDEEWLEDQCPFELKNLQAGDAIDLSIVENLLKTSSEVDDSD
ncbi:hypothetical protein FRB99_001567 [Tulasnella sp. 403]|nr:hypothetical protein FRB99_001567 [Tulasnella sp. 403]